MNDTSLEERKRVASRVLLQWLTARELKENIKPPSKGVFEPYLTDGIEKQLTESMLDVHGHFHGTHGDGSYAAIAGNVSHVAERLKEDAGIDATVIDCWGSQTISHTRLLIDINQPDFDSKLETLLEKAAPKLVENAQIAQDGVIRQVTNSVKANIPVGIDGKPIDPEQAKGMIRAVTEQMLQLAEDMGIKHAVAGRAPGTGFGSRQ